MVDFLTTAERSLRMSRIRSRDTKPELSLRRRLHRLGLRYRLGGGGLPGRPDLVFPKFKAVVFVHGCFWHRHPACKIATTPKSNTQYWLAKFNANVERDARVREKLADLGWRSFVVWECDLASKSKSEAAAKAIAEELKAGQKKDDEAF